MSTDPYNQHGTLEADGPSAVLYARTFPRGKDHITAAVAGVFDGATATLQWSTDRTEWYDVKDESDEVIALTAAGMVSAPLSGLFVRWEVTGADTDTAIKFVLAY